MRHFVIAIVLAAAAPLQAQTPTQAASTQMPARAIMLEDVERSRQNVLKYVDAAPDSMLGYRPSPGVRTYAEQIEHAAGANIFILSGAWKQKSAPMAMDTAKYRHNKVALRSFVNQSYDAFAAAVKDVTDEKLVAQADFGGIKKIGWRWISTALEHTTWTLGQTVPYLRANKVTPPQYLPF